MMNRLVSDRTKSRPLAPGPVRKWLAIALAAGVARGTFADQPCQPSAIVEYGSNVVVGQDIMLVRVQETPESTPSIKVRRLVDGAWPEIQTLTPLPGHDRFTWAQAMATDGQTIVIGDFNSDFGGLSRNGSVTTYRRQGNVFGGQMQFTAPGSCNFQMFGGAVAVDKDTLVVSRPNNTESCGGPVDREAYIYRRVGSGWTYTQSVVPPPTIEPPGFFGISLVVVCDNVLVGSYGRVFKYHFDGTSWMYKGSFKPGGSGDMCGRVMAAAGRFVAVGDPSFNPCPPSASVHILEYDEGSENYSYQAAITSPQAPWTCSFGMSVALAGETLIVGQPFAQPAGVVYAFQRNARSNAWNLIGQWPNPGPESFGYYVAAGPGAMAASNGVQCHLYTCPGIGGFTGCGDGDLDGDGLLDEWETSGIPTGDPDVPRFYLNSQGSGNYSDANPLRKDIYIEVDAVTGYAPSGRALLDVQDAFLLASNALVNNPNGQDGIVLHIQPDDMNLPDIAWTLEGGESGWPDEFDDLKLTYATGGSIPGYFGTAAERALPTATAEAIRQAKRKAFRYCIFGKSEGPGDTTSGRAELGGNDFYVTLGLWSGGGTVDQQAGTFMHELGHTLGLGHGGRDSATGVPDESQYKPNYFSVMNYLWQSPGQWMAPGTWSLANGKVGFSTVPLPDLNEAALAECAGVSPPAGLYNNILFPHNTHNVRILPVTVVYSNMCCAVDWNNSSVVDCTSENLAVDINRLSNNDPASPGEILRGREDWSQLQYNFRNSGQYADGTHLPSTSPEMTFELHQYLNSLLPPYCQGDANLDRAVNIDDLVMVITNWGIAGNTAADVTGNGLVNIDDLVLVITRWGACP